MENEAAAKVPPVIAANDCFASGKFTFEPEFKPIRIGAITPSADFVDNEGMSFGGDATPLGLL